MIELIRKDDLIGSEFKLLVNVLVNLYFNEKDENCPSFLRKYVDYLINPRFIPDRRECKNLFYLLIKNHKRINESIHNTEFIEKNIHLFN